MADPKSRTFRWDAHDDALSGLQVAVMVFGEMDQDARLASLAYLQERFGTRYEVQVASDG